MTVLQMIALRKGHMSAELIITEVICMINSETLRKLREMNLDSMVETLEAQESNAVLYDQMSFDDRLALIVDEAYSSKNEKHAKRLINGAKFRYKNADVNTLYYGSERKLDRNLILNLSTSGFIRNKTNLIITGFTGAGKTHLACAIGKEACRHLYRTRYYRTSEMFEELNLAYQTTGNISKKATRISNYQLLILDEWLLNIPSEIELRFILEILEKRYDNWPTIIISQYKQSEWHKRLGGGVLADSIMDRIVHGALTVSAGDVNMREYLASHPETDA